MSVREDGRWSTLAGRDPYKILGVPEMADAAQIKSAYRKKARVTHPDAGGTPEKFAVVQAAYELLCDPTERAAYRLRKQGRARGAPAAARPAGPAPPTSPSTPPHPGPRVGPAAGVPRWHVPPPAPPPRGYAPPRRYAASADSFPWQELAQLVALWWWGWARQWRTWVGAAALGAACCLRFTGWPAAVLGVHRGQSMVFGQWNGPPRLPPATPATAVAVLGVLLALSGVSAAARHVWARRLDAGPAIRGEAAVLTGLLLLVVACGEFWLQSAGFWSLAALCSVGYVVVVTVHLVRLRLRHARGSPGRFTNQLRLVSAMLRRLSRTRG